jgi:hypothetical protein
MSAAPAPSDAEQAVIDRFEAAPEPEEIVEARERLERVAEALLITVLGTDDRDFLTGCDLPADEIARLIVEYGAAAAIAALESR